MIYTERDYLKEKRLVIDRIQKTAYSRAYPLNYLVAINPLIEEMYEIYQYKINEDKLKSEMILKAFDYANESHKEQYRKYTNEEYIVHLREVASLMSSIENVSEAEIIAGILHDIVEKTNNGLNDIKKIFGDEVATHVNYLTDKALMSEGNRTERLVLNFNAFKKCKPSTNNIKACDILSNTRSIMLCDARYGKTYFQPIKEYMNNYFQTCPYVDSNIKDMYSKLMGVSIKIINTQERYGIDLIEKKLKKNKNSNYNKYRN